MFVSKKRWKALEKRVADLERMVQSQPRKPLEKNSFNYFSELWGKFESKPKSSSV